MTDAWASCLEELATRLREQRAAVEEGRYDDILAFHPPSGLGPLPAGLAERAHDLLAEAEQLRAALAGAAAARGRDLRLVTAFTAPTGVGAMYIDACG